MVDLPCIIESQKIMDNKRLFKVADISQVGGSCCEGERGLTWPLQMLVVGEQIRSDEELESQPKPTQEELTWPDGLTAAMRNVRQERWRHRIDLGVGRRVWVARLVTDCATRRATQLWWTQSSGS